MLNSHSIISFTGHRGGYPEMTDRLTTIRTLETRATIARTIDQTEEILLDELRESLIIATTTGD